MTAEIFIRYTHFIGLFTIVSTLVCEHVLLKKTLTRSEISKLSFIDAIYGLAALIVLGAGLTLWFGGVGKPSVYYSQNWIFHLKITLFAIVGLLSIYPTRFFLKNRKGNPDEIVNIPKAIFWTLRIELLLLFVIPLLAAFMARGIGFFGH